jgi:ACS family hexuronate transporter-like MFS transporter
MSNAEQEYLKSEDAKSRSDVSPPEMDAASVTGAAVAAHDEPGLWRKVGTYRWVICALLFFATTINYVDRAVLGILAKDLQTKFNWSEADYANINAAFQAAYAIGMLVVGRLIDVLGTRAGYAICIAVWSIAAMSHALARSAFQFGICRFALGIGESGNFPCAVKTVAEWFPKKERALTTGIFNAGSNVGAILAPLMVFLLISVLKMPYWIAFVATGVLSFTWLAFWLINYRRPEEHPRVKKSELAYIQSDPVERTAKVPWAEVIPFPQTWAFAIGKLLTDPVWWFWLFWLPKILGDMFKLKIAGLAIPLVIIYVAADFGSVIGGWISSSLLRRGATPNRARKTAMLICGLCVLPVFAVPHLHDKQWVVIGIFSLACAAHQGWSANLFTTVSDMFPKPAVGSVVGFGGMFGALGGLFCSVWLGKYLDRVHSYAVPMAIFASAYLVALLIFHVLVPKLQKAPLAAVA